MRVVPRLRIVACVLACLGSSAWSADGRILNFEGDVRVNGTPVTADTQFNRADTITTAPGASAKIMLSDGSVLDLDGGSEILIKDYSFDPDAPANNASKVDIVTGTLRYVSGRIAKDNPDNISFTAGNSTIGVRGTFISISVDPPVK